MRKATERLEQRHDARVAEAQRGRPLPGLKGGALESIECLLRQDALVTDPFDFEELAINLVPEVAEKRQVVDGLGDVEILGIVDGRFGAERPLLFEVLLDVGVLVFDVETRLDTVSDDTGAIAVGRRRRGARDPQRKE